MTALEASSTASTQFWQACPVCGQLSFRSKKVTGPDAEAEVAAFDPDPRCFLHLREARPLTLRDEVACE